MPTPLTFDEATEIAMNEDRPFLTIEDDELRLYLGRQVADDDGCGTRRYYSIQKEDELYHFLDLMGGFMCSSSIDFAHEETKRKDIVRWCKNLRGFDGPPSIADMMATVTSWK